MSMGSVKAMLMVSVKAMLMVSWGFIWCEGGFDDVYPSKGTVSRWFKKCAFDYCTT